MKITKPTQRDIHAASHLVALLDGIEAGEFDADELKDLRELYDQILHLTEQSPGFYRRIIAGMCLVVMNKDNKVIDPDSDVLDLHPDIKQAQKDTDRLHFLFRQIPGFVLRSIVPKAMGHTGDLNEIRVVLDDAKERSKQEQIKKYGKVLSEP